MKGPTASRFCLTCRKCTFLVLISGIQHFPSIALVTGQQNDRGQDMDAPKILSFDLNRVAKRARSHDDEQHRRRLGHSLDHVQTDTLYQGYGTHYVDLWVGTPVPQRQTVIVDTGSSATAFPCTGCTDCGERYHTDDHFDPSASATFRKLTCSECEHGVCQKDGGKLSGNGEGDESRCDMKLSYAEGSQWSAFEATDMLYTGGSHTEAVTGENLAHLMTPVTFGCQTSLNGLFRTQLADGIMGMSKSVNSFWDQLYRAGKVEKRQFSLCFSRHPSTSRGGTRAGSMTVGGVDYSRHKSPMVYAKDVGDTGFYSVYVKKIYLRSDGGESAQPRTADQKLVRINIDETKLNSKNVILDSGTTDSYLPADLLEPFKVAWEEATGQIYSSTPVRLTNEQLLKLPTIIVQLRGIGTTEGAIDTDFIPGLAGTVDPESPNDILLAIPATHYMTYERGKYFLGIHMEASAVSILGANAMQGHDVFFDLENSRLGFAEADCDMVGQSNSEAFVESIDSDAKVSIKRSEGIYLNFSAGNTLRNNLAALGWDCHSTDCAGFLVLGLLSVLIHLLVLWIAWRRFGPRLRKIKMSLFTKVDKDGDEVSSPETCAIIESSQTSRRSTPQRGESA